MDTSNGKVIKARPRWMDGRMWGDMSLRERSMNVWHGPRILNEKRDRGGTIIESYDRNLWKNIDGIIKQNKKNGIYTKPPVFSELYSDLPLPDEILVHIFSYLVTDPTAVPKVLLFDVGLVSKQWHRAFQDFVGHNLPYVSRTLGFRCRYSIRQQVEDRKAKEDAEREARTCGLKLKQQTDEYLKQREISIKEIDKLRGIIRSLERAHDQYLAEVARTHQEVAALKTKCESAEPVIAAANKLLEGFAELGKLSARPGGMRPGIVPGINIAF